VYRLAFATLLLATPALAQPLPSTVTRAPVQPMLAIVPVGAGTTPLERHRSRIIASPDAGTPVVALVELPPINSPDVVKVVDAHLAGSTISIAIETRRFVGPLRANVVTVPLIEIELGRLPAGDYTVTVDEQVSQFGPAATHTGPTAGQQPKTFLTVWSARTTAAATRPGPLASSITLVDLEPAIVAVPASAGSTVERRYHAPMTARLPTRTPLVAVIRLANVGSSDTVTVVDAHRDGSTITVAVDTRRYVGILSANVVTTPLVEIELGALPPGTYHVTVGEQVREFDDRHVGPPTPGLAEAADLVVR
jgi:hypothetical protein